MVPVKSLCSKMRKRWERWQRRQSPNRSMCRQSDCMPGIFTKLDGEEYAVIEKNKDILVAAANRGYFDESDVIHFYRDQSPGERDGHGPVNGAISMYAAIILAISGADCAVWQIYTVHFLVIPVRRGTCFCMQERSPVTHRRKRSVRSAGAI